MPTISEFYGIYVQMYFDDKHVPHFHAIYGEHRALIDIATGKVLAGSLPPRAHKLVREWQRLHRAELAENWERARRHENLKRVRGLE